MAALPRLRIWLLGGFRVELDGRPIDDRDWLRNRARAIVKLLALANGHRLHREQLMDALWPELGARAAGANLRKAVHFARRALGPSVLVVSGDKIAIETAVEIDVAAFESAADQGQFSEAIGRYAGDLLPEDRFEPWSDEPRERLRRRFLRCLADLAAAHEQAGDVEAAKAVVERIIAEDPLDEAAHRALMRLQAATGARHLALLQYRQLEATLRSELGVEPEDASRELFAAIVAGTVGSAPSSADEGTAVFAEERKLVTVLSAEVPTKDGQAHARSVLESWGATVAFNGSIVRGVFGVPVLGEDDHERAIRAALELSAGGAAAVRIGIATGMAIVAWAPGKVPPFRFRGSVSAVADTLREAATAGRPMVSARTSHAAGVGFQFGDPLVTSGERLEISAVELLGEAPRERREPRADPPLVGRRIELTTILGTIDDLVAGAPPRLVVVSGAAGIGKSRLIREAFGLVAGRLPAVRVLRGRSLARGRGATYWALGEILRDACAISLADEPDTVAARLRATVEQALEDRPAEERDSTVFALAASAGIWLPDNPVDALPPEDAARAIGVAWPRFLTGLAARQPTVLALEDLHWASPELLDMVEIVAARSTGRLLVLATTRPELRERAPAFGASLDASTIALTPLSEPESRALLDHLIASEHVDVGPRDRILDRAEGNPFYLEQLTTHLRDVGREGLPDTLQSLLGARLDVLPPPERRVLQEASVVGRVFWAEPVEQALPGERAAARLAILERKRFIVRRPTSSLPGHEEFAFRHALLHDAAYGSLPRLRRARAHASVGRWIEAIAGPRANEVIDVLAQHFEAAVVIPGGVPSQELPALTARAVGYLDRAGTAARRRYAIDRALDLHERALRLAADQPARVRLLEDIAEDHESAFHGDLAAAAYREAMTLAAGPAGDPASLPRLARRLAWLMVWNPGAFRSSPDPADAEALVAAGLAAQPENGERGRLLLVRGAVARLYRGSEPFGQGSRVDPRPLAERVADVDTGLAIGKAVGDDELVAAASQARGMLYGFEGRFADMLELARLEVARLTPDSTNVERSDALRRLAVNLMTIEADFETGVQLGRESRALAGDSSTHQLMHSLWPIMHGLFQLGRWDELLPVIAEDAAAFRVEPAVECQFVRDGPVIGATTLALLGRGNEARELAALLDDPLAELASASAWQARHATLTGRPDIARAISHDKALERRTYGPQHAYALLEALEALVDWSAVEAFLPAARASVVGNATLRPLIYRVTGEAKAAAGDVSGARRLLRRSGAEFGRLGMTFEARRAMDALAGLDGSHPATRSAIEPSSARPSSGPGHVPMAPPLTPGVAPQAVSWLPPRRTDHDITEL